MQQDKLQALKRWMVQKGCKVHPSITIPARIDGVLGIATNATIPHKTLILAVPSKLIITTTKCYNDPRLRKLFEKNDDLFDYEASQDAEFNVLCVFMMYHRIFAEQSEWKQYFQALSQPQTAVDWSVHELAGLNRSLIEEATHVYIQCKKLEQQLVTYLKTRKEFAGVSQQTLRSTFNFCYKSVMTRSFGYYFSQTCLIPVADLVNHGCQCIDHQLMNVNFESQREFQEGYFPRRQKIDCALLDLKQPQRQSLPFRERFLVENAIIENKPQALSTLDRQKINEHLLKWNKKKLEEGQGLQNLHFCSEDEEEDNDTDEQFEVQKERELENCRRNEEEQMGLFTQHFVTIERYEDVQKKLQEMESKPQKEVKSQKNQILTETKEGQKEEKECQKEEEEEEQQQQEKRQNLIRQVKQEEIIESKSQQQCSNLEQKCKQTSSQSKSQEKKACQTIQNKPNPFTNAGGKGVPIQIMPSDSEQQDSQEDQWGLKEGSYFTMSTSSPIAANKQVYNSYGSRTNKFLLIWYGFCYPNNLHDSVTLRLHVQFTNSLRPANEIVIDSYVGGQGLSFRKNQNQVVKQTQLSRQMRFKRSNICEKLLIFLRLYLMNYYKGEDLYKLFVTFPASVNYQIFVFNYYKDIIAALYDRYPISIIEQLRADAQKSQNSSIRHKIVFKIIYLIDQRKLLDINMQAADSILRILSKCKENRGVLKREMYQSQSIQVLRVIRKYLIQYNNQKDYIVYDQSIQQQKNKDNGQSVQQKKDKDVKKAKQRPNIQTKAEEQEWSDQDQVEEK